MSGVTGSVLVLRFLERNSLAGYSFWNIW